MNTLRRISILFLLLLLASLGAAQSYTLTDLGVLPGDSNSVATAMNGSGHIVGCSGVRNDCNINSISGSAFLWTERGGMRSLQPPPGGGFSLAVAINDSDDMVGYVVISANGYAALWPKNGGLELVGQIISNATGINDRGEVIGTQSVHGAEHPFVWSKALGKRELYAPPGSYFTIPVGINRSGHVCGITEDTATYLEHSLLWTRAGILDLGTLPGGTFSYATAINNLDEVVGYGDNGPTYYEGYLWNKATGMQDIGSLDGSGSNPLAVNDLSQVVGYASLISIGNHAFVWSKEAGMQDLNNLIDPSSGWVLTSASGINANGQITGVGTFNQLVHSYLLTPKK